MISQFISAHSFELSYNTWNKILWLRKTVLGFEIKFGKKSLDLKKKKIQIPENAKFYVKYPLKWTKHNLR